MSIHDEDRKQLAEAAIPLEVLCGQIRHKPYKEMTLEFQNQLLDSMKIIEKILFGERTD